MFVRVKIVEQVELSELEVIKLRRAERKKQRKKNNASDKAAEDKARVSIYLMIDEFI